MTDSAGRRRLVVDGREFESLESAARAYGMSRNTLDYRLAKGWTPEEACGLKRRPGHAASTAGIAITVQGLKFDSIRDAAKHFGRSYTHIFARLKDGCTIEQALGLVVRTASLQSEYPDLAKQWHPTRNAQLTASDVTPHSGRRVWWLCGEGHEWDAVVNSRSRGYGCPFCAGQRPTAERNLATEFPELIDQWDHARNGDAKPQNFTPRSKHKAWWKCGSGHSWQATIGNRTRPGTRNSCPVCLNKSLGETNCLAVVRPDIANDWHPTRNAPLTPRDVIAGGSRKVWWICKHGHEWQATVGSRVHSGTGCSKCSLQTSRVEIAVYSEIAALFDDVAWRERHSGYECDILIREGRIGIEIDGVYWHRGNSERDEAKSAAFEAAGIQLFRLREDGLETISKRDVSFKSAEREFLIVSRLVERLLRYADFSERQTIRLRDYVQGCGLINEPLYRKLVASLPAPPPGQSLADKHPEIAKQWALDLNAPLSPEHFRPQANKRVWWRCESGHTWQTTPNIRVHQGTGCPRCPREPSPAPEDRNLAVVNPKLAADWHPDRNGTLRPTDVWPNSNKKIWWQCREKHEWQAVVSSRAAGTGCPVCYGRYATTDNNLAARYPELMSEWDRERNAGLNPSQLTPHVGRNVWWLCKNGHKWQATVYNRTKNRSGCPECARKAVRKYSIEDINALAKRRGGECLSPEFTSSRLKLKFRCKEGHVWEARADAILYANKWCPECGRMRVVRRR